MPVKKKATKEKAEAKDQANLCDLLSRLPEDGFVAMVSNSGLPREEVRELCDAFRKLKE
jgi:hypothetical protein